MSKPTAILFVVFAVLSSVSLDWAGEALQRWSYTQVTHSDQGQECLGDCLKGKCVIDWDGNKDECSTRAEIPAPAFRTAQVLDKERRFCRSNCGLFGSPYEWCVTDVTFKNADNTTVGTWHWDYCNSATYYRSVYKINCTEPCAKKNGNYFWCVVQGGSWQYCAPPACP